MQRSELKSTLHLTQGLMVSGALNIVLLALSFFWMVQERPHIPWAKVKPVIYSTLVSENDPTTLEKIQELYELPFELLIHLLKDEQLVEDGYMVRDLALSLMVSQYHFDLERALHGLSKPYEERLLVLPQEAPLKQLPLYPGLSGLQFLSIERFARQEKYPFIAEELFALLKKNGSVKELIMAFTMTTLFSTVEKLFIDTSISPEDLLKLILEGEFVNLKNGLSRGTRAGFLQEYLSLKSPKAALLFLKYEGHFALKKLDDLSVMTLLTLLPKESAETKAYAKDLLTTNRSEIVQQMARETLNPILSPPIDKPKPQEIKIPFVEKPKSAPKPKPEKKHTVAVGETLWKISKKYSISVDAIKAKNHLSTDSLKPGMVLLLP